MDQPAKRFTPSPAWDHEDSLDLYQVTAWGKPYFGINEAGHVVVRPDGTKVKLLPIRSDDGTTNCTFGGPDGRTLFITSFEALWKVEKMPIPGLDFVKQQRLRTCPDAKPAASAP